MGIKNSRFGLKINIEVNTEMDSYLALEIAIDNLILRAIEKLLLLVHPCPSIHKTLAFLQLRFRQAG